MFKDDIEAIVFLFSLKRYSKAREYLDNLLVKVGAVAFLVGALFTLICVSIII